jgi:hypothetical protein
MMARNTTFRSRAGYRSARPITSKSSLSACNARPVHTEVPYADFVRRSKKRAARPLPSYDLLAAASLRERGPDRRCKKLDQGRDVRDRFNIEDGLLNRRLAI